jgi:hypothetical protein
LRTRYLGQRRSLIAAWRERGRDLGFGAGIAQGYATLGQIGFSERSGYTAIGTVCNVAARLCAEAKDGQILLSQRVKAALKGGNQAFDAFAWLSQIVLFLMLGLLVTPSALVPMLGPSLVVAALCWSRGQSRWRSACCPFDIP